MGNYFQTTEVSQKDKKIKASPNSPDFYSKPGLIINNIKVSPSLIFSKILLSSYDIRFPNLSRNINVTIPNNTTNSPEMQKEINKIIENRNKNIYYTNNNGIKDNLTFSPIMHARRTSPFLSPIQNKIKTTASSLQKDIRKIYKIGKEIGKGHFGTVRLGYRRNENPRKYYAIKSISKKSLNKKDLADLIKEVDIISELDHPNIIKFYETYHDDSYFHIVMELCKGKEVFDIINKNNYMTEKNASFVIFKLLHAIAYCHSRGITHRDLKPENILFENSDFKSDIKLIDFGLSKKYASSHKMHTKLGTPFYIAPEILKGEYDEKCDIWSIGAITYILLCGELPFNGDSNTELFTNILTKDINFESQKWNSVSSLAKNFIRKCLNKNPEQRPSSHDALKDLWFNIVLYELHSAQYIQTSILQSLKEYNCTKIFKKMVYKYLINTLPSNEINKYKSAFFAMDLKHIGSLTFEELEISYKLANFNITKEDIESIFLYADDYSKGSLDYTEFLIASVNKKLLLNIDSLKAAFSYFDVNCSGFIEIEDLKDSFLRLGKEIIDIYDIQKIINEVSNTDSLSLEDFFSIFESD